MKRWLLARRKPLLDSALLFCLASILIGPLFRLEYLNNWPSIESTFISEARMLAENLPHPGWQPMWYCGTRFDYIYPPALQYGTALISVVGHASTARAYHLYTAVLYAFGIVAVYWLVLAGSGWRAGALLSAAASALVSPSFALLTQYRHDSPFWTPQRLHVLMAYGEGPHISSLCVLPAALAACFIALRSRRPVMTVLAGVFCALTAANNFYGAVALAILFALMTWSVWAGERTAAVWLRAAAIIAIAYGLSAFWFTPSYVRVTLEDLQWVSSPGNAKSRIAMMALLALFGTASLAACDRRREREWPVFLAGAGVVFSVLILGLSSGFRIIGEAHRLIPEYDLLLILIVFEVVRQLWMRPKWRVTAVLASVIVFLPAIRYLAHAWSPFPASPALQDVYEYRITNWVHEHFPSQRVLPSGTVRFWFDAWKDNAQPDGGSEQGMLNQIIAAASWQILHGDRADLALEWLQALGADAVIVPDKNSLDAYRDYGKPEKFAGAAPLLYDDGHGTRIYRVPRVHEGIGRVVDEAKLLSVRAIRGGDDADALASYAALVEDKTQPETPVTWSGFDRARIDANVAAGQAVLLQETFDPAWRAYENGSRLRIRPEPGMDFMLIEAPPGAHHIEMRFETPLENRFGQALFVITVGVIAWIVRRRVVAS